MGFSINVNQVSGNLGKAPKGLASIAFSAGHANAAFDVLSGGVALKNLASGAVVSTSMGNGHRFAAKLIGPKSATQWAPGQAGFAGFSFSVLSKHRVTSVGGKTFSTTNKEGIDYGWIRLEFTDGTNGLPNSITVIDWAYNDTPGATITAGEAIPSSAPEPASGSLAILAAGAAGVTALRRRKKAA